MNIATFTNGQVLLPEPSVKTELELLQDFAGGQPEQLFTRDLIHTMFALGGADLTSAAVGDHQSVGTTLSITNGSRDLTVVGASFTDEDIGKIIQVPGAGVAGAALLTSIVSITTPTLVVLHDAASTTLSAVSNHIIYGTDDSTTIQAEIESLRLMGGGVLTLPPRAFALLTRLDLSNAHDVHIRGYGAKLARYRRADQSSTGQIIAGNGCVRCTVSGVYFDGNHDIVQAGEGANVTSLLDSAFCGFRDCHAVGYDGSSAWLFYTTDLNVSGAAVGNFFENCTSDAAGGFYFESQTNSHIDNCLVINHFPDDAHDFDNTWAYDFKNVCTGCQVTNSQAIDCDTTAFGLSGQTDATIGSSARNCLMQGRAINCARAISAGRSIRCRFEVECDQGDRTDGNTAILIAGFNKDNTYNVVLKRCDAMAASIIECQSGFQTILIDNWDASGGPLIHIDAGGTRQCVWVELANYSTTSITADPFAGSADDGAEQTNRCWYHRDATSRVIFDSDNNILRVPIGGESRASNTIAWDVATRDIIFSSNSVQRFQFDVARNALRIDTIIWATGTGTPEGAVTAPVGSFYSRTDGGAGTSFYVKETGSGNTGWVGK